eukprot:g437.t1
MSFEIDSSREEIGINYGVLGGNNDDADDPYNFAIPTGKKKQTSAAIWEGGAKGRKGGAQKGTKTKPRAGSGDVQDRVARMLQREKERKASRRQQRSPETLSDLSSDFSDVSDDSMADMSPQQQARPSLKRSSATSALHSAVPSKLSSFSHQTSNDTSRSGGVGPMSTASTFRTVQDLPGSKPEPAAAEKEPYTNPVFGNIMSFDSLSLGASLGEDRQEEEVVEDEIVDEEEEEQQHEEEEETRTVQKNTQRNIAGRSDTKQAAVGPVFGNLRTISDLPVHEEVSEEVAEESMEEIINDSISSKVRVSQAFSRQESDDYADETFEADDLGYSNDFEESMAEQSPRMVVAKKQAAAKIAPKAVAKGHPVFASTQQAAQAAPQRQAVQAAAATRSIGIQADGGHDVAVQCEVVPLPPLGMDQEMFHYGFLPARSAWAAPPFTMAANRASSPGTATNVAYNPTASAATATDTGTSTGTSRPATEPHLFADVRGQIAATNDLFRKQLTLIRAQITQAHMRADAARKAASFVSYTSINTSPAAFVEGVTDNNS